jgi:hypothetical protein
MITITLKVRDSDISWLLERISMLVAGTTAVVRLKPGHWSLGTSGEWTLTQNRKHPELLTLVCKHGVPDNAVALRHSIGFLVGVEVVG